MFGNSMFGGFAPSIEETGVRPQGPGVDAIADWQDDSMRQDAIRQTLADQYQNLERESIGGLSKLGGYGLGRLARPYLRPLAQSARQGIAKAFGYGDSGRVTVGLKPVNGASNSLLSGVQPATSEIAPTAADQAASLSGSLAAEPGASGTLLANAIPALGATLSLAGLGYGAYKGISSGLQAGRDISAAADAGWGDRDLEHLRQQTMRSGEVESGIGAGTGAIAGATAGTAIAPGIGTGIGAAVGARLGSLGGDIKQVQAYREEGDNWAQSLGRAAKEKFRHPFR